MNVSKNAPTGDGLVQMGMRRPLVADVFPANEAALVRQERELIAQCFPNGGNRYDDGLPTHGTFVDRGKGRFSIKKVPVSHASVVEYSRARLHLATPMEVMSMKGRGVALQMLDGLVVVHDDHLSLLSDRSEENIATAAE